MRGPGGVGIHSRFLGRDFHGSKNAIPSPQIERLEDKRVNQSVGSGHLLGSVGMLIVEDDRESNLAGIVIVLTVCDAYNFLSTQTIANHPDLK